MKTAVGGGHYDGANVIPAKFRTQPCHFYSEGTEMRVLSFRACNAQPAIYNFRPEAGRASPWFPDFPERAKRIAAAKCDYAFELHTNWSTNSKGVPNRGVFLVIVSLCFEAGVNQKAACEAEKALATKLWKPLADKLGLKFEIRTKQGGGKWDYYSFLNFCKKRGIPHPMIIEHGYHMDYAENETWYAEEITAHYAKIQAMTGGAVAIQEPDQPPKVNRFEYVYSRGDYLGTIGKRFGIDWRDIERKDGKPLDSKNMHYGDVLLIPGDPPPEPVYFTTTKDCYTLWAVSRKFGVDWQSIRLANGMKPNEKGMQAGIKLRVA